MGDYRAGLAAGRRARFLKLLAGGVGLAEAIEALGIRPNTYYHWRQKDTRFRGEVDKLRVERIAAERFGQRSALPDSAAGFGVFVRDYFPDRLPAMSHQLSMVDVLMGLRPRDVVCFLIWPEARKTGTLEDYICYRLAREPDHRFRVISQSQSHSRRIMDFVKRRMTDTGQWADFIARWGPFHEAGQERRAKPWHADEITVAKAAGDERDRSLVASSWSSATYGSRIDTLIVDDVCALENVTQSAEIVRRLQGTFLTRGRAMKTIIIGTRIGPDDVYQRLFDAGLLTRPPIIWPAADYEQNPTVPDFWQTDPPVVHDGNACCRGFRDDTCPHDQRPLTAREFMELVRHQVREDAWWSHYQQRPIANPLSTFASFLPPDSDLCCDTDRRAGELIGA